LFTEITNTIHMPSKYKLGLFEMSLLWYVLLLSTFKVILQNLIKKSIHPLPNNICWFSKNIYYSLMILGKYVPYVIIILENSNSILYDKE
jgi:hypothetical protein